MSTEQQTSTAQANPKAEATTQTQATATPAKTEPVKTDSMVSASAEPAKLESAKPVVPEKYDLKLPKDSLLKEAHLEKIAAYAKERGFSNEQAQALLEREHSVVSEYSNSQKEFVTQNDEKWFKQLQSDKELGGDKLQESGQLAYRAAAHFFGDEFVSLIKEMKLNHHPILFKGLHKLGKAMASDQMVHAPAGGDQKKSIAERLYGAKTK